MSSPTRLDPDRLADLEERRAFLLGSLDDLEAEVGAGDIDQMDYEELKADYTLRLADTQRSLDQQRNLLQQKPPASKAKVAAWIIGLSALGLLAGIFIAQASGNRLDGESGSGGVRLSVVSRLNQARALFGDQQRWPEAYELYDGILEEQPAQTEALTYNAWLRFRSGDWLDESIESWEEVSRIDPTYPDALVFRTIALTDVRRYEEAQEVLGQFDAADPPAELQALVDGQGLRFRILGELNASTVVAEQALDLDTLNVSEQQALGMAGYYLVEEFPDASVMALKMYDAILDQTPTHPEALSRSAFIFLQAGVVDEAVDRADLAVVENPNNPEALLTQAEVHAFLGDTLGTCASLDTLDGLADVSSDIATRAEQVRTANCT